MRTTPLVAALGLAASLTIAPLAPLVGSSPASAAGETCDGKAATIVVQPTTDWPRPWVVGTPGDDVIVGSDGPDRIDGGAGNDTICGQDHRDHLIGGDGDDRLFGGLDDYYPDDDLWGDVVEPGPGDDYVDLGADLGPADITYVDHVYADVVSYAGAPGPVSVDLTTLTATGEGTDTFAATPAGKYTGILGSPFDDVLAGGPAVDQILGGGGDDVIDGGEGDDLLDGDATTSYLTRGSPAHEPGDDRVAGGPGDDVMGSGYGADVMRGEGGDDYFRVDHGSVARGGSGDDGFQLSIGRGTKVDDVSGVQGGIGRDRVTLDSYTGGRRPTYFMTIDVPRRRITLGGGRFSKLSGAEEFIVQGNDGRGLVVFRGGRGPEMFRVRWVTGFPVRAFGGGGADVLVGGDRADVLDGGPGRDRLDGQRGTDRCVRGERLRSCERRR